MGNINSMNGYQYLRFFSAVVMMFNDMVKKIHASNKNLFKNVPFNDTTGSEL